MFCIGASKRKRPPVIAGRHSCPRLDSNQHALAGTTTSKWLVYQFQHLGVSGCKYHEAEAKFQIQVQLILARQGHAESCALAGLRILHRKRSAMILLHYPFRERESKPPTPFFCGEAG
jgi:hypothetical protein